MDLFTGEIKHFPAGTFYAQHETPIRETEINLMKLAWRVYKVAQKKPTPKKPAQYDNDDLELLGSIQEYQYKESIKNHLADSLIIAQWKGKISK